jgi:hypothetical protein
MRSPDPCSKTGTHAKVTRQEQPQEEHNVLLEAEHSSLSRFLPLFPSLSSFFFLERYVMVL